MDQQILIETSGGVITAVYSSNPATVDIWDWDDQNENIPGIEKRESEYQKRIENLKQVY
jgi:hypothetical protein